MTASAGAGAGSVGSGSVPTSSTDSIADAGPGSRRADLRLLAPALTAWAAVALLLAAPVVAVTGLVALLLGGVVWLLRRSGSRQLSSRRSGRGGALPLVMAATALALLALVLQRGLRTVGPVVDLAHQGASVDLRAEVTSDPRLLPVSGTRRTPLVIVTLQARHVVGRGAESHVNAPVLAFAPQSWLTLEWGEEVEVRGRLASAAARR